MNWITHHSVRRLWGPLGFVALWLLLGVLNAVNPLFLPTLPDVASALWQMLSNGTIITDFISTTSRTFLGFLFAVALGVPTGLLLGSNPRISDVVSVLVDFFRSIPGTALFPLFLLFFGIGDMAKIANAVFACTLIILVNTMYGVRNVNVTRLHAARTMQASRWTIYFRVVLPSALPEIAGGLRIAVSIALIVIVVTEMFVGTASGLGKRIFHAHQLFQIPEMYAAILITGLLGYGLNLGLHLLEQRLIHWGGK